MLQVLSPVRRHCHSGVSTEEHDNYLLWLLFILDILIPHALLDDCYCSDFFLILFTVSGMRVSLFIPLNLFESLMKAMKREKFAS